LVKNPVRIRARLQPPLAITKECGLYSRLKNVLKGSGFKPRR
jgi:hypothetical protein